MKLLKVNDVMKMCGCGRATAIRLMKACGTLPRKKNETILVSESRFEAYLMEATNGH